MSICEHMEKFDPAKFGLSDRYSGKGRGNTIPKSKCYVLYGSKGHENFKLTIVLSHYAGARTIELLGKSVDFDFDKDGAIYFWSGNSRHISNTGKATSRYTVSVGRMTDDYTKKMGEFRRLYMKPEYYGNYVKLMPTGERDSA